MIFEEFGINKNRLHDVVNFDTVTKNEIRKYYKETLIKINASRQNLHFKNIIEYDHNRSYRINKLNKDEITLLNEFKQIEKYLI